jgi:hypothetical protein
MQARSQTTKIGRRKKFLRIFNTKHVEFLCIPVRKSEFCYLAYNNNYYSLLLLMTGLRISINLMRIRIQPLTLMRIRILLLIEGFESTTIVLQTLQDFLLSLHASIMSFTQPSRLHLGPSKAPELLL